MLVRLIDWFAQPCTHRLPDGQLVFTVAWPFGCACIVWGDSDDGPSPDHDRQPTVGPNTHTYNLPC